MRACVTAAVAAVSLVLVAGPAANGQQGPARPSYSPDGTTRVPAFDLPPSMLASPESAAMLRMRAGMAAGPAVPPSATIEAARARVEKDVAPQVQRALERYPIDIVEQTIAGVPVRVITPKGRAPDPQRVLINLHGGAFMICAVGCAIVESAPIAALGGYKVISVNYRQGPEAVFPAASEDVAAVYKALLATYRAGRIGIYGCSAGGALAAQTAAWLPAHGLPQAGAIGVFAAGGLREPPGDSAYFAGYVDAAFPPPPSPGVMPKLLPFRSYFEGADPKDPMVAPAYHPDVLAKFPPTLLITATRAPDLSPAAFTHSQLVKAGVPGDLIVADGLGHCYIYMSQLPEAQDAYRIIVDFFRKHLK
jgi:monoterpene epsilon-lactone hydrolase